MDDLYDNLENYNDVNIVDELKSENKELKLKLEEYSKAMVQLQKDFDKVNTEYKKLEINYSSLLKTARAEIQRKTEMINNLNLEKDMIIINTMKNKGKNVLNNVKNKLYSKGQVKQIEKSIDTVTDKEKQNNGDPLDSNRKDNRVDSHQTPSVDSTSSISIENKTICNQEKPSNGVDYCGKNKNKENLSKVNLKDDSLQSSKTDTNRRKSIPVNSNHEAKFSSEEDTDNYRKSPIRNDVQYYEWNDSRNYRTDSYEYYELPRDSSRSRSNKYTSFDKYKNVHKYEPFPRQRRHYSPERNQYRYTKEYTEYSECYPLRGDYGKQRITRSPPSDKYNRSKSRDRRYTYDRENYRDYDKYSNQYYEHSATKHKIRNELDEPNCKRQKTETYSEYTEETNSYNSNEKDRELAEIQRTHVSKPQEYVHTSSCQSPDYVVDSTFPHSVKEIMSMAATKLEDPRISSKKYILNTSNNSSMLSTVVGRNIDLKRVDKSEWGIEKVNVPLALMKHTSEDKSNDILKDIYTDIDNPVLHDSLESLEIQSYDDDFAFYSRENGKNYENENSKSKTTDSETRNDNCAKEKVVDKKAPEGTQSTKFKIPKIKKLDKYPNEDLDLQKIKNTCDASENSLPVLRDFNVDVERHQPVEQSDEHTSNKQSIEKHSSENNIIENSDCDKRTQEVIKTIEDDLELSDEASDIVEFPNNTEQKIKSTHESNMIQNIDKDDTNSPKIYENNSVASTVILEKTSIKKTHTPKSSTKKSITKDSSKDSSKKRKSKRRISEQNEINSDSKHQNEESHDVIKSKECKETITTKQTTEKECVVSISKQTLNKFSDLFGDSSSLITPDDLGINNVQVQSAEKYSSIFENTQDAVDLSVEDMTNTLTNISKVNNFDTVLDKLHDEKAVDTNSFNVNVTIVNDNNDNKAETKNVPLNNVYENAESEILTNEPSIVKTVIISSGIQPECVLQSISKDFLSSNGPSATLTPDEVILKKCPLNSIKALATSTPQKCTEHSVLLSDSVATNTIASTEETNASSNLSNSSNLNITAEPQNEADVPDVRIFVRRRRKLLKKPA